MYPLKWTVNCGLREMDCLVKQRKVQGTAKCWCWELWNVSRDWDICPIHNPPPCFKTNIITWQQLCLVCKVTRMRTSDMSQSHSLIFLIDKNTDISYRPCQCQWVKWQKYSVISEWKASVNVWHQCWLFAGGERAGGRLVFMVVVMVKGCDSFVLVLPRAK